MSKNNIIRVLSGYNLGVDHDKIMKCLSNYYGLKVDELEQMYKEEIE